MASRIARRRLIGSQERAGQKSPTAVAVTLMGAGGAPYKYQESSQGL
jgi:hypothetical protein